MKKRLQCVDAGSEYCPCYLAETNDCITCSILQGKDFCDCNWRGTCIYQEYVWNGNKRKESRDYLKCKIESTTQISNNSFILKIKVTKTLARLLKEPGSYVFLRGINLPQHFDMPMSVLDADDIKGYIKIAYQILGPKTKRLNMSQNEVMVKGPYWNGLLGVKNIKVTKNSNCLLIARGIAQAPISLLAKKLLKRNNKITFILDEGNLKSNFIEKELKNYDIKIIKKDLMKEENNKFIKKQLLNNNYQLISIGGSDLLQSYIIKIIDDFKLNADIVVTNNNEICCGEGVCGACTTYLEDGTPVKTCKTQLEARKTIERRIHID
ncbi:MAG: sulfide/dihydroorotate dehydrogenase-like FAD/NAD-binding protein [Firmicutes bacterium]|nr:sulfide/dihydroorotate dehydrogenase-like FAD/NAD-binding protein [Bacillota bacterium]